MNSEKWKEHPDLKVVQAKLGNFYHIEECIGGGKYSNVYLVKLFNGKQALKIMDMDMMEMELSKLKPLQKKEKISVLTQRFLQEGSFYGTIEHPNIVKIISIGVVDDKIRRIGIPYILMNYIDGLHLDDILKQKKKLPWKKVLEISVQILDALSTIHEQKVIHRDIKPSNIMIDKESGKAVIIDFGLAKDLYEESGLTKTGELPGTPQYMSPEQCKSPKGLTPATDIYSFGVVLYKMLTGKVPFVGESQYEIMYGHWSKPVPLVDEKTLRLPPGINKIICKALAKEPADRYENAREFLLALEEVEKKRKVRSPENSKTIQKEKHNLYDDIPNLIQFNSETYHPEDKNFNYYNNQKNPGLCGLMGSPNFKHSAFISCLAIHPKGTVIASGDETRIIKIWDISTGKEQMTLNGHTGGIRSVKFSPLGDCLASSADDKTIIIWEFPSGKILKTLSDYQMDTVHCLCFMPDKQTLLSGSRDGILKKWNLETGTLLKNFTGHNGPINALAITSNGNYAITASDDKTLKLWDILVEKELKTFTGHIDYIRSVMFTPDDKTIISGSWDNTIKWWDNQSGRTLRTIKAHREPVTCMDISYDGTTLLTGSIDKTIKIWDRQAGKIKGVLNGHIEPIRALAFCPDGNSIITASKDFTIRQWDITSDKEIKLFQGHQLAVSSIDFSPDGQTLISASWDGTLKLWDIRSGKEIKGFPGHKEQVHSVRFSPDGQTAVSGSLDNTLKLWNIETGKHSLTLRGHQMSISSVTFTPDGSKIVSGSFDHTIKVWHCESAKNIITFKGHRGYIWDIAVSPDGQKIVSASEDGTVKLWNMESGQLEHTFGGQIGPLSCVKFSPDNRYIVAGSEKGVLYVWDTISQQLKSTLSGHHAALLSITFSKDGKYILSSSLDYSIRIWERETGLCIKTISFYWIPGEIRPNPLQDGFYACANRNGTIALLDINKK